MLILSRQMAEEKSGVKQLNLSFVFVRFALFVNTLFRFVSFLTASFYAAQCLKAGSTM